MSQLKLEKQFFNKKHLKVVKLSFYNKKFFDIALVKFTEGYLLCS